MDSIKSIVNKYHFIYYFRDFLTEDASETGAMPEVDLKVMLPNQTCKTIKIDRSLQTTVVLRQILESLQIESKYHCHFGLFETIENTFERKLSPDECPFAVYVANFSTASATCIIMKPFIFSIQLMQSIVADDLKIMDLVFHQVIFQSNLGATKKQILANPGKSQQIIANLQIL